MVEYLLKISNEFLFLVCIFSNLFNPFLQTRTWWEWWSTWICSFSWLRCWWFGMFWFVSTRCWWVYFACDESKCTLFLSNIVQKSFLDKILTENPGFPCFCFGHSTGAAIVLKVYGCFAIIVSCISLNVSFSRSSLLMCMPGSMHQFLIAGQDPITICEIKVHVVISLSIFTSFYE